MLEEDASKDMWRPDRLVDDGKRVEGTRVWIAIWLRVHGVFALIGEDGDTEIEFPAEFIDRAFDVWKDSAVVMPHDPATPFHFLSRQPELCVDRRV